MDLPLDVKYKIASFDMDIWIRLSFIDKEFKIFSYGIGRKLFINHFTVVIDHGLYKSWSIFNKTHRDNDKPALIYASGTQKWYQNGVLHRDNDNPAVIEEDGTQRWYQNGKYHRKNDKLFINK